MKLALLIGPKGNEIKPKLMSVKDNLNIEVFKTVPEFIDIAIKKGTIYDRVLILSTMLDETKINNLHSYWQAYCKDTEIIMLCKKSKDEGIANVFMSTFTSVNIAPMLVTSTDLKTLAEAILLSPLDINNRYGIPNYLDSDTIEDEVVVDEPKDEPVVQQNTQIQSQPQQNNQVQNQSNVANNQQQKKKGGLFGGLFGKKNKNVNQNQSQNQQQIIQPNTSQGNANNITIPNNQNIKQQSTQQQVIQSDLGVSEFEGDFGFEDDFGISAPNLKANPNDTSFPYDNDFDENNNVSSSNIQQDTFNFDNTQTQSAPIKSNNVSSNVQQPQPQIQYDEVEDDFSGDLAPGYESEFVAPVRKEFHPVEDIVDDFASDVVDDSVLQVYKPYGSTEIGNSSVLDEVEDEDLSMLGVASAESAYREATQQTRVVTNTVVKEVIRTIPAEQSKGIGKNTALKKVLDGQVHKTILVTGDRATGVTLTAYNLALKFAEKVPVLYVDYDTQTHGLLNYIDYGQWQSYDDIQVHGIKYCNNSRNFNNCIVRYDDNLDILGSDFSSDISKDEIEQSAMIVAENLGKYGVVIIDCPSYNIEYISELILTANTVMCVEGSKRGFMNMLCAFENNKLSTRYKRAIVNRGTMLVTKCNPKIDIKQLIEYINKIFIPEEVDWLSMDWAKFSGKFSTTLLNSILEG